jgi:hypothetical protein
MTGFQVTGTVRRVVTVRGDRAIAGRADVPGADSRSLADEHATATNRGE